MLVSVRNTAVVLFLEVVVGKIRVIAASQPKLLDELFAFFVSVQLKESLPLFGRNNVDNIFAQPLLVLGVQFLERLFHFPLVLFIKLLRSGRRVGITSVLRKKLRRSASKTK